MKNIKNKRHAIFYLLAFLCAASLINRVNASISSPKTTESTNEINGEDTTEVWQNEIILTNKASGHSFIYTGALNFCVGLILQTDSLVALAHLDGHPMSYTLKNVITKMTDSGQAITAEIITSPCAHSPTVTGVKNILGSNKVKFTVSEAACAKEDMVGKERASNVGVIKKTGKTLLNPNIKGNLSKRPKVKEPEDWKPAVLARPNAQFYPMLKFLIEDASGNLTFSPDATEKYIVERSDSKSTTKETQDQNIKNEEDIFREEQKKYKG